MVKQAINATRQTVVASDMKIADTYLKRLVGLMGQPVIPEGFGLWIVPCSDIHSCFMRVEFDAVFLDRENRVLHVMERMKPWRISKFVKGGRAVLELPAGVIAATGTQIGDQFEVRDADA